MILREDIFPVESPSTCLQIRPRRFRSRRRYSLRVTLTDQLLHRDTLAPRPGAGSRSCGRSSANWHNKMRTPKAVHDPGVNNYSQVEPTPALWGRFAPARNEFPGVPPAPRPAVFPYFALIPSESCPMTQYPIHPVPRTAAGDQPRSAVKSPCARSDSRYFPPWPLPMAFRQFSKRLARLIEI